MYQNEILDLKNDIIKNGGFEGCIVSNNSFSGIRILGVRKIKNSRGLHCIFIDLEDFRGLGYWVETGSNKAYFFSKPLDQVGCHIDIYGDDNSITIMSDSAPEEYSQTISGLSANHSSYGHSSTYIYAIKTNSQIVPPVNEAMKTIEQIEDLLKHLKGLV